MAAHCVKPPIHQDGLPNGSFRPQEGRQQDPGVNGLSSRSSREKQPSRVDLKTLTWAGGGSTAGRALSNQEALGSNPRSAC